MKVNFTTQKKGLSSMKDKLNLILLSTLFCVFTYNFTNAQTTVTLPPGTLTWTVPAGVTAVNIQAWGGGGAGGGSNTNNDGGAGGGGGGYVAQNLVPVSGIIAVNVGAGGVGAVNANGTSGGNTTILGLIANGGAGGPRNTGAGGLGGTASGGTVNTSGNNGGVGGGATGGNGGASPNGGAGGAGQNNINGSPGTAPGGGGGGGEAQTFFGTTNRAGGNGGAGRIVITYTLPTISSFSPNNGCVSPGTTVTIIGTGFTGATSVDFNGVSAVFTINSNTSITATVPAGATSGLLAITNPYASVSSAALFTVNPQPVVSPITGTTSVCPGGTTPLSNANPGGVWSSANTSIAAVDAGGIVTGVASGSTTISYTVSNLGCSTTVTTALTVYPNPVLTGPNSVCLGNTVQFTTANPGTWTSNDTSIATIDNSGNLTTVAPGTTTFTFIDSVTGCTNTTAAFTVDTPPAITSNPVVTQTVCSGDSASFTVTASGGTLTYQWYKGSSALTNGGNISGATSATLTINPVALGDAAINYHCIVSNACVAVADSNNSELIVNQKPVIPNQTALTCSEFPFVLDPVNGVPTAATIVPINTVYSWPAPVLTGGMTGGSAQSGQPLISETLSNPTNIAQTATYTVTPTSGTSGNCIGNPFTLVVTVNPLPLIGNLSPSICSGENLIITPTNGGGNVIPAGTTYTWGAPTVTGGLTGGSAGINQSSINVTLTNPTNTVQTANYNVTATSGSCTGSVFSIAVTVNPKPTVSGDLATQTICTGTAISPITLSNPNNVGGTIDYSWTRNNTVNLTGMPAGASGSPITGTLTNLTNTPQTTTFTLYATSDEGCLSNPVTVNVVVNPAPTVASTPATQTICSGNNITAINFSNPNNILGTGYSWTRDNTANLTGIAASGSGTSIIGALTNTTLVQQTTIFTISATASGCGTNTTTVTVIVNPRPDVAAAPATQTLCAGIAITPIVITNPNAISGTTFSWTRSNVANTPGIAASGTMTNITGTLTNSTNVDQTTTFTIVSSRLGCPSTSVTADVIVRPTPLVVATPGAAGACSGAMAIMNFTTTNNLIGTTFDWTRDNVANIGGLAASGSGDISAIVTNTTPVNQVSIITIVATAPNGCTRTITATLTVYAAMTTPGIQDSQVVCAGSRPTTFFITTPVVGGSGTYIYQWQSSTTSDTGPWTNIAGATGATYQPPTTNGTTPNTWYQVTITSCGSTVTSNAVSVVVANNSNFSFSIDFGGGTFCAGSNFNPRIYSAHGGGAYIRYTWIANPTYITPTTGGPIGTTNNFFFFELSEATLPLVLANNTNANVTTTIFITPNIYDADTNAFICSLSPQTTTVTIRPRPTVTPTAPNALICTGTSAGIVVTSNVTPIASVRYNWTRSANVNVTSTQATGNSGFLAVGSSYTIPDVLINNSSVNQDVTYTITPTSNPGGCAGTPNTITITVGPQLTPGVVGTSQVVCNGSDPAAFTEITPAIGSGLSYQWQSNTVSATGPWTNIPGATGITYDAPGPITQTTWFIRVVSNSASGIPCSVATTTAIQLSVNNINPGVIATNQTICSGGNPGLLTSTTAATGSGAITYQWQSNTTGCGDTFTDIGGAVGATYDPPAGLLTTTYYRRAAISTLIGTPCINYSNCITVFVNTVTPGIVGSDETLCGNNPSAFTESSASAGAGTLTYQWQSNTTGCGGTFTNITGATLATYDPPAGLLVTTYYRRVTTSTLNGVQCTAISNCITVTANSVTAGSIGANRTVCMGGDPAAFTETSASTGTNITYQWQSSLTGGVGTWSDILGATGIVYDVPGPVTQVMYYRRITISDISGNICTAASNSVTVFVNDVTASTIAGDQAICSNDPVAFTIVTPASGLGTITYQWQRSTTGCGGPWTNITGATSATYDPPIAGTTNYQVVVTSTINGVPCTAVSNCLTVTSNVKIWTGFLSTDWNTAVNWSPNGVPTSAHCVIVPNTTIKPYILGANYTAYAYSLTILNGGTLEIIPTNSLTVTDIVDVNPGGTFNIKNSSSLVQINNVANIGNINMERSTQPMYRYDYTYWSSPLTAASAYTLGNLSPNTQPDKYYSWTPSISGGNGNWAQQSIATLMIPAKGYIVRAPNSFSTNPSSTQAYTANFIGVPNNGDILAPIAIGTLPAANPNDKLNLIGNPYPSAVDADAFLNEANNVALVDGTIYFWTHHSPPSAAYANPFYGSYTNNYTSGDYATYNTLGGTNTVPAGYGGPTPNGYIAAGQSFFIKGTANGNAIFKNSMRDSNNGAFFRMSSTIEKHRVWLNLANAQGGFSQILVGYAEGATNEFDRGFDGNSFGGNFVSFYSVLPTENLTIQGRSLPFDENDQVQLGFNATVADTYTIGIDHLDGLMETQSVYLEDQLLNVIHDIKASPYSFASVAGNFNTRFVLRYTNSTLSTQNSNLINPGLIAFINDQKLKIQASQNIIDVQVYDLSGKMIAAYSPATVNKQFEKVFNFAEGIYFAKVELESGLIVTSKLSNRK